MRRSNRFTALCVGVLLLAAPAVFACGELGAMTTSNCSMSEAMGEMSESMSSTMGTAICHDSDQMSDDCCDVRSAPEPMEALSFESARLLTVLEATELRVAVSPAPAAVPLRAPSADAFRLHELGRYTLFSSFLI